MISRKNPKTAAAIRSEADHMAVELLEDLLGMTRRLQDGEAENLAMTASVKGFLSLMFQQHVLERRVVIPGLRGILLENASRIFQTKIEEDRELAEMSRKAKTLPKEQREYLNQRTALSEIAKAAADAKAEMFLNAIKTGMGLAGAVGTDMFRGAGNPADAVMKGKGAKKAFSRAFPDGLDLTKAFKKAPKTRSGKAKP